MARPTILDDELRARTIWATALYAGLRRGEIMGLRWTDLDLASGAIHVEQAWDPKERVYVAPKSRSGRRRVPIAGALRDELLDLRASLDRDSAPDALVFGNERGKPFDDDALAGRSRTAWASAGLESVTLHEARHTAASLMIAAGVNVKALSEFLGHASITITLDRYGHLLPGSLAESASLLDAFLVPADARAYARDGESLEIEDSQRS